MDDGSRKLEQTKQRFTNELGQYFDSFGANVIMGRIFSLLIFSARPLSLTEIAKELQISKAAVSINIRALKLSGLVEKAIIPGDRSDYYCLDSDYGHSIYSSTMKKVQNGVELMDRTITSLEEIHTPDDAAGRETELAQYRLTALKELFEFHCQMIIELQKHWSAKK